MDDTSLRPYNPRMQKAVPLALLAPLMAPNFFAKKRIE
jgi:hypothetical protein